MNLILWYGDFMNITQVGLVGEELPCKREMHNPHDLFAVSVTKDYVCGL